MKVEYFFLADKAEAIGGKLYVFGGSWDTLNLAGVPALAAYDLAASVAFTRDEGGPHDLTFELVGPDAKTVIGPLGGPVEAKPTEFGETMRVLAVLRGPFPHAAPGKYQWRLRVDGEEVATVSLSVVVAASIEGTPAEPSKQRC